MSDDDKVDSILALRQTVCELKLVNAQLERDNSDLRQRLARYQCRFPNVEWFKLRGLTLD